MNYMCSIWKSMIKHTSSLLTQRKRTRPKKRKGNQLCIRIFAFSCTRPTWKNYHSKTVGSLIKHGVIYSSFHDKKQEMSNLDAVVSAIYPEQCIMSLSLGISLSEIGDKVTYQLPLLDHKMSLVHGVHHFFILEVKSFLWASMVCPFFYTQFNLRIPC